MLAVCAVVLLLFPAFAGSYYTYLAALTVTAVIGALAMNLLTGDAVDGGVRLGGAVLPVPREQLARASAGGRLTVGFRPESTDRVGPGERNSEANQFYSLHAGRGAQFLFGDGHAAYLKSTMDYKTYLGLSTRAGAEVVSGDAY